MSVYANYVAMTLSGTPGTGTATLNAALASPDRSFLAAYGAVSTTVDVEWYSDANTTVRIGVERNCVYNGGSPGTLTRGTPETPNSLVSIPSGASVRVALPASSVNRYESAALTYATASVTTANVDGVVGQLSGLDLSGLTAARNYVLPAVAAVGDRCGFRITATHATAGRELIYTAASGDTLEGIAGGTEVSRCWQVGESMVFECIVANTTWIVAPGLDGRIACKASMTRTTVQTMPTGGFNKINCATSEINIGGLVNTASSRIDIRRAGSYLVGGFIRIDINSGKSLVTGIGKNTTVVARGQGMSALAAGTVGVSALSPITLAAADQMELYIFHDQGANVDTATVADSVPRIYVTEAL